MSEKGAALITVLLIATLAAILSVSITTHQQVDIRRTANILHADQAYVLAQGVEEWGRQLLIRDGAGGNVDSLADDWAKGLFPTEVEGGTVSGYIEDLQAKFNVNNLAPGGALQGQAISQFGYLLDQCDLDRDLVEPVIDWLDDDSIKQAYGAEDDYYLDLEVGYRTANQTMVDYSELRLVMGIDMEGYQCLLRHITILPDERGARLNVNTASAQVLASLEATNDFQKVEELLDSRPDEGYGSVQEFVSEAAKAGLDFKSTKNSLAVQSSYFMAHVRSFFGRGRIYLDSMLHRDTGSSNYVVVLQRSVNRHQS